MPKSKYAQGWRYNRNQKTAKQIAMFFEASAVVFVFIGIVLTVLGFIQ